MPTCLHPSCGREELPHAAAFPRSARVPCAHVNKKNEPCPDSASTEVYDLEALTTIVQEDKLWDLGPTTLVQFDKPEREFAEKSGLEGAPPAQIRAAMMSASPATVAKKPAKRAAAKKAPAPPVSAHVDDEDETDRWDP